MNKNSEPYKDGRYRDLFEAAESSQIVGEEVVHYSRSVANMRNMKAGLEYRFEEGRAEGRAEGREEGREEGRAEEKARNRETMRRLLDLADKRVDAFSHVRTTRTEMVSHGVIEAVRGSGR